MYLIYSNSKNYCDNVHIVKNIQEFLFANTRKKIVEKQLSNGVDGCSGFMRAS